MIKCKNCGQEFFSRLRKSPKYCSRKCWNDYPKKHLERGYVILSKKKGAGRIREHVIIAEKAIGRKLKPGEIVHHINMIKTDNRTTNLLICSAAYHTWLHQQYERRFAELKLGRVYV